MTFGALVVTFTWLAGYSIAATLKAEHQRVVNRTPIFDQGRSGGGGPSYRDTLDVVNGIQFTIRWLELPTGAPLPPGLDENVFRSHDYTVSPALASALALDGVQRFGEYGLIADEGLRNRDEFLAYGRIKDDSSMGRAGFPFDGYGFDGGSVATVPPFPLAMGMLAFLVTPSLVVLGIAATARSAAHSYRCQLLRRIGMSSAQIATMGVFEAVPPAFLGVLVGLVAHRWWSVRTTSVPLLGRHVIPGDMVISIPAAAAVGMAVVIVTALFSARTAVRRASPEGFNRPTRLDTAVSHYRMIPFVGGLALLLIGLLQAGSRSAAYTILAGAALTVIGVVLVLPLMANAAGKWLGQAEAVTTMMIGRRLERDPRRAMRPMLLLGAATTLTAVAIGYLAVVRFDDEPRPPDTPLRAVLVRYTSDGADSPISSLSTGSVLFAPLDPGTGAIQTDCPSLNRVSPVPLCDADGVRLSEEGRATLGVALGLDPRSATALSLGDVRPAAHPRTTALAIGPPIAGFTEKVRTLVQSTLTAPEVSDSRELGQRESPLVRWILAGLTTEAILAGTALVLLMVERYSHSIEDHRILGILGLTPVQHWRMETGQFALTYTITAGVAFICGLVAATIMTQVAGVPMPIRGLWFTAGSVSAVGVGSTACVAMISRSRLKRDDIYTAEVGHLRWTS